MTEDKGEDRALKGRRELAKEVGGEQGGGRTHTKEMGEDSRERGREQQKWVFKKIEGKKATSF